MKRTNPSKQPVLSWTLIVRNCSDTLETTLKSLRARTPDAEIVIVDTMSSEGDPTPDIARRYADVFTEYDGPMRTWTREMHAFDDAAAARNHALFLAHGKFVAWIDSDDELVGPELAKELLIANKQLAEDPERIAGQERPRAEKPRSLEDVLLELDAAYAGQEFCLLAPYLYRFAEGSDRIAAVWQSRERIVRNNGRWTWANKGHEVLVPKEPRMPYALGNLSTLLFVHRKKFTAENDRYGYKRHANAILKDLAEKGSLATQQWVYLCGFARVLPELRHRAAEFVEGIIKSAVTPLERTKAQRERAIHAATQGYWLEMREAIGAGIAVMPELPDAYITGAILEEQCEDWARVVDLYEQAFKAPGADSLQCEVPLRDLHVRHPFRQAIANHRLARIARQQGNVEAELLALQKALTTLERVMQQPALGEDAMEVGAFCLLVRNELSALQQLKALEALDEYLRLNDSNEQRLVLAQVAPWTLRDHPAWLKLTQKHVEIRKHLTDKQAYQDFYTRHTDAIPFPEDCLPLERNVYRAHWLVAKLKGQREYMDRPLEVMELGAFDGNIAIPVLQNVPGTCYTLVDADAKALERAKERIGRLLGQDVLSRCTFIHSMDFPTLVTERPLGHFDAVVIFEVIEHVQDPTLLVRNARARLNALGTLYVSCPWGDIDNGTKPPGRTPLGHVRAFNPRDLVELVGNSETEFNALELKGDAGLHGVGAALVASFEQLPRHRARRRPVTFLVPGSLWPWNASSLLQTGMGASEETVVHVARMLARDRNVEVYGPLPVGARIESEVHERVRYYHSMTRARIDPNSQIIVSRSPSAGAELARTLGCKTQDLDLTLWLQDVGYSDLNPEVAQDYKRIVVLTDWHKQAIHVQNGVPLEKMVVIGNFLLREHFQERRERDPNHYLYASSPDRGLIGLLRIWPKIREMNPKATLTVAYGWRGAMRLSTRDANWLRYYKERREQYSKLINQPGVTDIGMVSHTEIARIMLTANAYLYPSDPGGPFAETFCSNAIKAQAAGMLFACSMVDGVPHAGLATTAGPGPRVSWLGPDRFDEYATLFADAAVHGCTLPESLRRQYADKAMDQWSLDAVMPAWWELLRQ